jgi:SAM-dependent methyltransferase
MAAPRPAKAAPLGPVRHECLVCNSPELTYEFLIEGFPACSCQRCGLLFLNPGPSPTEVRAGAEFVDEPAMVDVHAASAASTLFRLEAYAGLQSGRLLLVNPTLQLELEARARGFDVAVMSVASLESEVPPAQLPTGVQACVIYRGLETTTDPLRVLESARRLLAPGGCVLVVAPTIDSRAARLFRLRWWEFRKSNRFYFSADTLQSLVLRAGYGEPIILPDGAVLSLDYVRRKLRTLPRAFTYRLLAWLLALAPRLVTGRMFRSFHSRTVILARMRAAAGHPALSVVMPVYNEKATFVPVINRVLQKTLDGLAIHVVIVESNSDDGTREQVMAYADHPRVTVILEDRPLGKGHAVRRALGAARGEIILIQDADLEYDIDDYDALVQPILRYERNFIIGSRHLQNGRVWKIRQFNDAAGLAAFFNLGHVVFLGLFNVLYEQRLNDPFSMFKVFRRECLFGLSFECNRFDFDFELVIKLLRKGYQPLELPVNYTARSFTEGKKVSVVRDPLTWVRALAKFRTSPLYEWGSQP